MPATKSSFLDKVIGRIGRLDAEGLQTVVQRLARERSFLETLFNSIEDGVLVVDAEGRIAYLNQAVTRLLGLQASVVEGQPITRYLPELDWEKLSTLDQAGGQRVVRHEFEVQYPHPRFIRLYAAPLDGESAGSRGLALILHDATEAREQTFAAIESERVQALTLLAASVAHEIGNPLNALHIHLQLMERELKNLRRVAGSEKPSVRTATRRARAAAPATGSEVADIAQKSKESNSLTPLEFESSGGVSPRSLLDAMRRLGVAERRPDGRVNVPDIYRVAAKLLRKGGVRPIR